ncbi:hypothetical protein B0T11DRAFT_328671 [Plectosphaerella cucumerina]|uniref:DUF1754-domain-containing protein n=1 Tax=Plectosphaerella cucumerina TaxID=40658 RepID=A0A8K0TFT6_9PEZI|nr:hypothetical protein B0T11DRAFT_328671 [Plectosphaerella cucumerina]
MPADDYASIGGGGLRLKGAKVSKKKKKSKSKPTDLEKNLGTGDEGPSTKAVEKRRASSQDVEDKGKGAEEEHASLGDEKAAPRKTEAELRFEERRRKRLLELSESSSSRPELLKTHKERVEELNTYLSKLSEHHDMPKIGPG